jgi:hypothetical protein
VKAMGFNIVLQDELGESIDGVDDPKGLLGKLLPEPSNDKYPFIGSIDPYGDTTFNSLQMPRFLNEWSVVAQSATTSEEQSLVEYVEKLARRCRDEIHVYL